ncbi:MAG TPA: mechanosensitive ion channel family protein [Pyrinomonadaceae bacterium]|nr:mechanosensitive ion channel family protein [Pyrinomonadaceae bacterium]
MTLLLQVLSWSEWFLRLWGDVERTVLESIRGLLTSIFGRLPFLLAAFVVLVLFWVLTKLVRYVFLTATRRTKIDSRLRLLISRLLVVGVYILGVFTALTVVIPSFDLGSVIAGLGFTSFVVGFATKDILNNFLSGILILWQRPFEIGDYLFIGKDQGKVEYIGVRATTLRKDDGELLLIPNGDMYSSALTIRGAGAKRRMTVKFNLGYDTDIDRAKDVVLGALTTTDGIVTEPKPNVYVSDLVSEGVLVTVNFWLDTNENRPLIVFDGAAISIMKALNADHIELFPPGSMIVQQAKVEEINEDEELKKRSVFD